MSLKAKLEAVIYAAEEPVTLNQLAALFAADALEWKAEQEAAAREQTAEVAGVSPDAAEKLPLIEAGLEYLGLSDTPAVYAGGPAAPGATERPAEAAGAAKDAEAAAPAQSEEPPPPPSEAVVSIGEGEGYDAILVNDEPAQESAEAPAGASAAGPEAEARRLARQRDREVKAVLKQLLDELMASYAADGRGVEIREIAGGYRMATKPECHDAVRLFVKSLKPPLKLSLPALETLAVIAYKQPVTAPEVNEIRGVESAGVLGSLLARKLIATAGRKPVIGRPILYKTTREFLLRFGLKDVSELPSMEEFEKMAATELEMEPEVAEADKAEASQSETDSEAGSESLTPAIVGASTATPGSTESQEAPGEENAEENAEAGLESNSPSGEELAATAEAAGEGPAADFHAAASGASEPADVFEEPATSIAEPAAGPSEMNSTAAPPTEPDSTEQAEIEANPHAEENHDAEEDQKEGRAEAGRDSARRSAGPAA